MGLQKTELPVGTKVRGWGMLNEYGQFDFTPEQTGTRQGSVKKVLEGDGFAISETKDKVLLHMSIKKQESRLNNVMELCRVFNELMKKFKDYDF